MKIKGEIKLTITNIDGCDEKTFFYPMESYVLEESDNCKYALLGAMTTIPHSLYKAISGSYK